MADEDHLDRELTIFAEVTPSGFRGGATSRSVTALDRLVGSVIDALGAPLEGLAKRERARQVVQAKVIDALGAQILQRVEKDEAFAAQAIEQHLKVGLRRQENKQETARLAIEDLRQSPPTEEQNKSGPEELSPDFLNRFERYAEDASSEQMRMRWARVLASEIRAPGIFSAKVMRIVDEMDSATAALFERVCQHRLGDVIIKPLAGELDYMEERRLVSAGLIVEPGLGQVRLSKVATTDDGKELNLIPLGVGGVAFLPHFSGGKDAGPQDALSSSDGKPAVSVYLLTDEGHGISSIIDHDEHAAFTRYRDILLAQYPNVEILEYRPVGPGRMHQVAHWNQSSAVVPSS